MRLYLDLLVEANTEMDSGKTVEEAADSALNNHRELSVADRRVFRERLIAALNDGRSLPGRETGGLTR